MKIFLDTSVLLAATLSSNGASACIVNLCAADLIQGFVTTDVFEEALNVIQRKFPDQKALYEKVMQSGLTIKKAPKNSPLWARAKNWIKDPNDVMILVGAKHLEVDYLITLDLRDFIKDTQVGRKSELKILTPGDFLEEYARFLKN